MLEKYLNREDVKELFKSVTATNTRFSKKNIPNTINDEDINKNYYDLLVALDAIIKYAIIIEDEEFFIEYLDDIRKLLKKVENHNDIKIGIIKSIINSCKKKLHIISLDNTQNKKKLTEYVYDKYITNGYMYHAFPSILLNNVNTNGLVPNKLLLNEYTNIDKVLKKYKLDYIEEEQDIYPNISITDSFFMAAFYSYNTPLLLNKITAFPYIENEKYKKDCYFRKDYEACLKNLDILAKKESMFSSEKTTLKSFFNTNWDYFYVDNTYPVIAVFKRSLVGKNNFKEYNQTINNLKNRNIEEVIEHILDTRFNNEKVYQKIDSKDLKIIKLPTLEELNINRITKKSINEVTKKEKREQFLDDYGNTTILALVGILLITLGITITIIMIGG